MARERSDEDVPRGEGEDTVDQIEQNLLGRRSFLLGTVTGALGVGAVGGAGLFFQGGETQRRATLAGDSTVSRGQYRLPAVSSTGEGFTVGFTVSLTDGSGGVYVNLDDIEVRHDVQAALREATDSAARVTDRSLQEQDVLVSFDPPGDGQVTLSGKSWEAGLTAGLAGALSDETLADDTLATGIVGPDGGLLPVGEIEAKAVAARESGAETLLVPPEQSVSVPGIDVESVASLSALLDRALE